MINNFVLIIGAMKCGTTSLFNYLAEHPQICPSCPKEPNFFASDSNWAKGLEWYQSLWQFDPAVHKFALEASTHYTKMPRFPNAAERIAQIDANFKFIYIMRNPIDRIVSHHIHGQIAGWKTSEKSIFEEINSQYIEVSRYARQIEEYYKRFPASDILLLNFDDLKQNPTKLLRDVCLFLEIDPDYKFQEMGGVHNSNQERNQRLVNGKAMNYSWLSFFKPLNPLIPQYLKNLIKGKFGRKVETEVSLSPEQKEFILNVLRDDLKKLSTDYGFDVSRWGIKIS